jgi:hypothetical protein
MYPIQTYVPKRNYLGQFKNTNYKRLAKKTIIYQLIALSVIMNIWFVRHTYVIRCAAGGMFMSQQACGDEADAKFDSTQLAQTQNQLSELQNNQDLTH